MEFQLSGLLIGIRQIKSSNFQDRMISMEYLNSDYIIDIKCVYFIEIEFCTAAK